MLKFYRMLDVKNFDVKMLSNARCSRKYRKKTFTLIP